MSPPTPAHLPRLPRDHAGGRAGVRGHDPVFHGGLRQPCQHQPSRSACRRGRRSRRRGGRSPTCLQRRRRRRLSSRRAPASRTTSPSRASVGLCGAKGSHIVTAATEHKAVLNACKALESRRLRAHHPAGRAGRRRLAVDAVEAALRPDTVLVSLMHANNEIGVVHDIAGHRRALSRPRHPAAHRCHAVGRQGAASTCGRSTPTCSR